MAYETSWQPVSVDCSSADREWLWRVLQVRPKWAFIMCALLGAGYSLHSNITEIMQRFGESRDYGFGGRVAFFLALVSMISTSFSMDGSPP